MPVLSLCQAFQQWADETQAQLQSLRNEIARGEEKYQAVSTSMKRFSAAYCKVAKEGPRILVCSFSSSTLSVRLPADVDKAEAATKQLRSFLAQDSARLLSLWKLCAGMEEENMVALALAELSTDRILKFKQQVLALKAHTSDWSVQHWDRAYERMPAPPPATAQEISWADKSAWTIAQLKGKEEHIITTLGRVQRNGAQLQKLHRSMTLIRLMRGDFRAQIDKILKNKFFFGLPPPPPSFPQ